MPWIKAASRDFSGGASPYLPLRSRTRTIGRDGPACELLLAARVKRREPNFWTPAAFLLRQDSETATWFKRKF